jgi:hypothetical protein
MYTIRSLMNSIHELEARRDAILDEMRSIRSLRRGNISEQFLKVQHQGIRAPVLRGPYYVLMRRDGKRVISQRVSSGAALEQARKDIESHKRFVALCREFEIVTEQLGELERGSLELGQEKKRHRLRLNRKRK